LGKNTKKLGEKELEVGSGKWEVLHCMSLSPFYYTVKQLDNLKKALFQLEISFNLDYAIGFVGSGLAI
jgi:hypothetical protein